jgi:hypothetical protein
MKCFSLMLGARQTGARGLRFKAGDERNVREITRRHFPDGFTILDASGGWFDPKAGRFVMEESRQVLVCASHRRALRLWCEELAQALRQRELLVVELGPAIRFRRRQ